jgi:hypothetical protein
MLEKLWDVLQAAEPFGNETLVVMIWTVCICSLRIILYLLKIQEWVPNSLIFANPYFVNRFVAAFSIKSAARNGGDGHCHAASNTATDGLCTSSSAPSSVSRASSSACRGVVPNMPIRIAESLLGRTPSVLVLVPAHLLGGIMGVTLVKLTMEWSPLSCGSAAQALLPVMYGTSVDKANASMLMGWWVFVEEILVTFVFVLSFLVVPELLLVNRLPRKYANVCALPLLLVRLPDQTPAFSPAALFSFWFTSRDALHKTYGIASVQYEHGKHGGCTGLTDRLMADRINSRFLSAKTSGYFM